MDYNYLELLNEQQRAAVVYHDGPSLVIAGAGSGKTRVLTYKIVDLLAHGYEPYRIMALTFTNKAAREMKERIAEVVGEKIASRLWMGTFHSIFLRVLRKHCDLLGYAEGFTIYDAADSRSLIKMIIRDLGEDEKIYKPATVASIISNAKNALVTAEMYAADSDNYQSDLHNGRPRIGEIYKIYAERCRLANAMDFDDILLNMNVLLRDNPDVKRHYQDFFRYIMVDEYQDTNFAQHLVISQLGGERQRVCVVGDDAQSIYSFRGANIDNILNLSDHYPNLRIFKLERNYRSTKNIIDAAGSLIEKNRRQMAKKVYSENAQGSRINVIGTFSDIEEAQIVAGIVEESRLTHHDSYDEYAILYRANSQSRQLEEKLRSRSIPYRIYGGTAFYQRKEIKDAVCYFRTSVNPDDDEALRRILNYPKRGIGKTTEDKIISAAIEHGKSLWHVICNHTQYLPSLSAGTRKKLDDFAAMISDFNNFHNSGLEDHDALALAQLVYRRSGLLSVFSNSATPEEISAKENLEELLAAIKEFVDSQRQKDADSMPDMSAFLSEVSLATDADEDDPDNQAKVTLMTVHASKGLEFKHVIIVGLEEEIFPAALSMQSDWGLEEERRLLYVAITRAKETCTITHAGSRFRNGQTILTRPSRFLKDIAPKYLNLLNSKQIGHDGSFNRLAKPQHISFISPSERFSTNRAKPVNPSDNYLANLRREKAEREKAKGSIDIPVKSGAPLPGTHTASELKVNMRIRHNKFGDGTIMTISTEGDPRIEVVFDTAGYRKLALRFARFDILD